MKQAVLDALDANDDKEEENDTTDNKQEVEQLPVSKKLMASGKRQSKRRLVSQPSRRSLVSGQPGGTTPVVPITQQAFNGQSNRELICNYDAADDVHNDKREPVESAMNKSSSSNISNNNNRHDDHGLPKKSCTV
jgi:hypothetical protein